MTTIASVDHRLTQTDGKLVGYARVSTDDQDCAIQITTLKRLGCKKIYTDQISGRRRERAQLAACLDYLREGDVLAITRVDRLGRSLADLIKIADELRQRDVSLYIAQQNIDTATPMGQMFYAMLGVFAEFEYHLKRERQVEGIARAKTAGRYKGRKPLDAARIDEIRRMRADGLRPAPAGTDAGPADVLGRPRQARSIEGCIPSSIATCVSDRPLQASSDTASRLNSSANVRRVVVVIMAPRSLRSLSEVSTQSGGRSQRLLSYFEDSF